MWTTRSSPATPFIPLSLLIKSQVHASPFLLLPFLLNARDRRCLDAANAVREKKKDTAKSLGVDGNRNSILRQQARHSRLLSLQFS